MERQWRSRAAPRPSPQARPNPSLCILLHPLWVPFLLAKAERGIRRAGLSKDHSAAFAPALLEPAGEKNPSLCLLFMRSPLRLRRVPPLRKGGFWQLESICAPSVTKVTPPPFHFVEQGRLLGSFTSPSPSPENTDKTCTAIPRCSASSAYQPFFHTPFQSCPCRR